jgi:hypothetical protein
MNLPNLVNESSKLVESFRAVSWETIVVVACNAITEEALPSYSAALRRVEVLHEMRATVHPRGYSGSEHGLPKKIGMENYSPDFCCCPGA